MNVAARQGLDLVLQTAAASAAMTASQRVEMAVTRRAPSDVPLRAVQRLTGHEFHGATAMIVGHLAQANVAAAAIMLTRVTPAGHGVPAVALIAGSLVLGDAALAAILGLAEMPWRWTRRDLAIDVTHKTSLALAAWAISTKWRGR